MEVYAMQATAIDEELLACTPVPVRRTITASVNKNGVMKMKANWVYQDLDQ
jgi:hypothetical protein